MQASSFGLCGKQGCRGLKARFRAPALRVSSCAETVGLTKSKNLVFMLGCISFRGLFMIPASRRCTQVGEKTWYRAYFIREQRTPEPVSKDRIKCSRHHHRVDTRGA